VGCFVSGEKKILIFWANRKLQFIYYFVQDSVLRAQRKKEREEKRKEEATFSPKILSPGKGRAPGSVFDNLYQDAITKIKKREELQGKPRRESLGN
jgi:hypothetical protein